MAKNRYIDTKFWTDTYITNLDPIEKLLFLYALTNPHTNIAGIYEISIKQIAFDTGIDKEMVEKIFQRFSPFYLCWFWVSFTPKLRPNPMHFRYIPSSSPTLISGNQSIPNIHWIKGLSTIKAT